MSPITKSGIRRLDADRAPRAELLVRAEGLLELGHELASSPEGEVGFAVRYKRELDLKPNEVTSIKYRIKARKVGYQPLTVKGVARWRVEPERHRVVLFRIPIERMVSIG